MKEKTHKIFLIIGIFGMLFFLFYISKISRNNSINGMVVAEFGEIPNVSIDKKVYENLKDNDSVRVIVKIKNLNKKNKPLEKEKKEIVKKYVEQNLGGVIHEFDKSIAVNLSKSKLKKLKDNVAIDSVVLDKKVYAFLQDSVPQINASSVWPIQISGLNITGEGETVCIIDTGINFSHPDLVGKNKTCIIDCIGGNCIENCSIGDDNGHGTHVAGIVGASGGINGVATNIKLIGVKALSSDGSGLSSDVYAGIDWCVDNANTYNISVISMSLGDCSNHSSYCNSDSSASHINNAIAKNISVVIAAGNCNPAQCPGVSCIEGPSSPACVENATAVGAVDKSDIIHYQRGSLFELLAPGVSINSTKSTGGYLVQSGTSMAAPHMAGVFALFREFFKLQNSRTPTPQEIKETLNNSGVLIDDSSGSGYNFSRVDIYSALISIDSLNPEVNLTFPKNNSISFNQNITFKCSMNDVELKNVTLYIWNSTGISNNSEVKNISGVNGESEFNLTLDYGDYTWNCFVCDEKGNCGFSLENKTINIWEIETYLNSPINNLNTNLNQTYNCSAETSSKNVLSNITIYIWNSTKELIYNSTKNISGIENTSIFYYNFSYEGNFSWNCLSYNNQTEYRWGNSNYTVSYDFSYPIISSVSNSVTTSSSTINWITNELSNSSVSYGNTKNLSNFSKNLSFVKSHSIILSGLSSSTTYYYNITSCDLSGNCLTNGTFNFTTLILQTSSNSDNGGGGGVGSVITKKITIPRIYIPTKSKILSGYTKILNEKDEIKFSLINKSEEHLLIVKKIEDNKVYLVIQSNILKIILSVGQSVKLNLSSNNYYDLFVKLNSITDGKANLTIQTIHENIPSPKKEIKNKTPNINHVVKKPNKKILPKQNNKLKIILLIMFIGVIGGIVSIIIVLFNKFKTKKDDRIKKYKKKFR